jgi:prepilin-type N-terminal cleavage/methylation domain-containing protein
MRHFFFKNSLGFTLVEMLIVMVIFILIATALYTVYNLNYKTYRDTEKSAEIIQNGRVILERMARELRQTKNVATDLSSSEAQATDTIIFEDGHDISTVHYIHYFQDGTNINREVLAFYFSGDPSTYVSWNAAPPLGQTLQISTLDSSKIIGEYVSDLGFWGKPVINITLTLQKQNKQINIKTAIFGRNL